MTSLRLTKKELMEKLERSSRIVPKPTMSKQELADMLKVSELNIRSLDNSSIEKLTIRELIAFLTMEGLVDKIPKKAKKSDLVAVVLSHIGHVASPVESSHATKPIDRPTKLILNDKPIILSEAPGALFDMADKILNDPKRHAFADPIKWKMSSSKWEVDGIFDTYNYSIQSAFTVSSKQYPVMTMLVNIEWLAIEKEDRDGAPTGFYTLKINKDNTTNCIINISESSDKETLLNALNDIISGVIWVEYYIGEVLKFKRENVKLTKASANVKEFPTLRNRFLNDLPVYRR